MTEKESLAARTVASAVWTILTGIGSRALGLIGTVVITYYLAREVLGEVSDAFVVALLASQFSTIGVGQYMVARKAGPDVAWHATVIHLSLGVVALGLCLLLVHPLGVWIKAPSLGEYLPGLVLSIFLDRILFIPERVLTRDMRFRVIGLERTAGEITYTITSVGLAMLGVGGMSVVYANIARSLLRVVVVLSIVPFAEWLKPRPFSMPIVRDMLRFGLPFSVGASASMASRRFDNALISSMFGAQVVGVYNLAYNVADVPAVQVGEQIGDVLLPSFAQMTPEERKGALVRLTGLLALLVSPLAVGLGAIAPTLVHAILRAEWADVAPMLMILSALSVTRPVGWLVGSYLQVRDRPGSILRLEVFKLACIIVFILALGRMGPLWACAGVGVAFATHAVACIWVVHRLDEIPFGKLLGESIPPIVACVPLVAAVLGARYGMHAIGLHQKYVTLIVEIVVGGIAYAASALVIARETAKDFLGLAKNVVRKRRGKK